jgi:hypothetical protein
METTHTAMAVYRCQSNRFSSYPPDKDNIQPKNAARREDTMPAISTKSISLDFSVLDLNKYWIT